MEVKNYYNVTVHGIGFRQAEIVGNEALGFYATFGFLAKNIEDIKRQLPEKFNERCVKHSLISASSDINEHKMIIEGMYSAKPEGLTIDGFSFYEVNLINRISFKLRLYYLCVFDPIRILCVKMQSK